MKAIVCAYVPPPGIGRHPESFLRNISRYKTRCELALFSNHPPYGLRHSEDPARVKNPRFPHYVTNYAFLLALQYAMQVKADVMILLEDDCRCSGDWWDEEVIEEAYSANPNFAAAGTPVAYNVSSCGHNVLKRFVSFSHAYQKLTDLGLATYGFQAPISLYPNGGGSVLDVAVMARIFRGFEHDLARSACVPLAYDMAIGYGLWSIYGEGIFDVMVPLKSVFSGCGDSLLNWEDRLKLLTEGGRRLIHQCKGPWDGA
jgi:hypothetical protein